MNNWHIAEFLPPKLKKYFDLIILEYLFKISQYKNLIESNPEFTNTIPEELYSFSKQYISTVLSEKLLDAIPELEAEHRRDTMRLEKILAKKIEYIDLEAKLIGTILLFFYNYKGGSSDTLFIRHFFNNQN